MSNAGAPLSGTWFEEYLGGKLEEIKDAIRKGRGVASLTNLGCETSHNGQMRCVARARCRSS